jgi:hypothetical protein
VFVDEAYWAFEAEPSNTIPRLTGAKIMVPYPWVEQEAHEVVLVTELGATFSAEIPVAVATPHPSPDLFARFGLVGIYVGIVPVVLGMLWFPFLRRLGRKGMNFVLSLTVGLLVFLAVGTWLDALEFARELPAFWQGVPMVFFVGLLSLGSLLALGSLHRDRESSAFGLSTLIATGIGFHNLGEGLAIGAAFALGKAALGTFLILGFTLHNITEGVGISAPLVGTQPKFRQFALLAGIAGLPAVFGTWLGGFAFNPVLATFFLAVGLGAILQVVWEVGSLVADQSARMDQPLFHWVNFGGLLAGIAVMYLTAFLVKF